jgi:hypothetical protein
MPIQLDEQDGGKILVVHAGGKLAKADYVRFVPEFERLVRQHGKLRVLFDMTGFHGWEPGALWEDIKFDSQTLLGHRTAGDDRGKEVGAGHGRVLPAVHKGNNPVLRSPRRGRGAEVVGRGISILLRPLVFGQISLMNAAILPAEIWKSWSIGPRRDFRSASARGVRLQRGTPVISLTGQP